VSRADLTPAVIGQRLASIRKSYGISQADLAKNINLPRSAISQMETGKRQITIVEVVRMAEHLCNQPPEELARALVK